MTQTNAQRVGLIGYGAMAQYVMSQMAGSAHLAFVLVREGRAEAAREVLGDSVPIVTDLPDVGIDVLMDCAGHEALRTFGPKTLMTGIPVITASIGALADPALEELLRSSALEGSTQLHLSSGAIGALDALGSAKIGDLTSVTYVGRKPPLGWQGSAAEDRIELASITEATAHFIGSARDAALQYPKNANVAAAVARAGLGFDRTGVQLIADPDVTENIHQIEALGSFGSFEFRIAGRTLPGTPRTSALAAMSMVKTLRQLKRPLVI